MKKIILSTATGLIALSVVSAPFIAGCTSTYRQESTGQYIDSSAITVKVKSALLADKAVKSLPITVKTYKNIVQLSGFVDTPYQKQRAIAIAQHVEGVVEVKDSLVIKAR